MEDLTLGEQIDNYQRLCNQADECNKCSSYYKKEIEDLQVKRENALIVCRGIINNETSTESSKELARLIGSLLEPNGLWYVALKVGVRKDD